MNAQNESSNAVEVHSGFAVADYLQLAGMARRSVTLTIYDRRRLLGRIDVQEGAPCSAEDGLGSGEPAFRRLALLEQVDISCQPLEAAVTAPNLSGSLEYLLMAAARDADDFARKKPSLPPRPVGRSSLDSVVRAVPRAGQPQSPEPRSRSNQASMKQILSRDASLRGVLSVAEAGTLRETCGDLDAETTAAVAILALRQVTEIALDLGLGRPRAFQASRGALSLYVVRQPNQLLASVGQANRNAMSVLKLLRGLAV